LLLAEDDRDLRELLTTVLEGLGMRVVAAADGAEALERLREDGRFDAAVLDVRMPKVTGIEVLSRAREAGLNVPIVLVTGFADPELSTKGLALGAARVVDKPLDPDDFRAVIAGVLAGLTDR